MRGKENLAPLNETKQTVTGEKVERSGEKSHRNYGKVPKYLETFKREREEFRAKEA